MNIACDLLLIYFQNMEFLCIPIINTPKPAPKPESPQAPSADNSQTNKQNTRSGETCNDNNQKKTTKSDENMELD